MAAPDVFISYVIGDKQTADLICSKLESGDLALLDCATGHSSWREMGDGHP